MHKDETNPNPTIYSAINKEDDMVKRETRLGRNPWSTCELWGFSAFKEFWSNYY